MVAPLAGKPLSLPRPARSPAHPKLAVAPASLPLLDKPRQTLGPPPCATMGKKGTGLGRRKSSMGSHPRKDEFSDPPAAATPTKGSKGGRWSVGGKQQRVRPLSKARQHRQTAPLPARCHCMAALYLNLQEAHNLWTCLPRNPRHSQAWPDRGESSLVVRAGSTKQPHSISQTYP